MVQDSTPRKEFKELSDAVSSWQSGDLIAYSLICERLDAIRAEPSVFGLDTNEIAILKEAIDGKESLVSGKGEGAWLSNMKTLFVSHATRSPLAVAGGEGPAVAMLGATGAKEATIVAVRPAGDGLPEKGASDENADHDDGNGDTPETAGTDGAGTGASADATTPYREDYFQNIITDQKMLAQLCDEIREHLDGAQFTLVDLEYDSSNHENINKIFRAFHTIKSSAAFLGFKNIEEVAHSMEDLLVLVRDGKLSITSELTDVIFFGIGLLRDLATVIEASGYETQPMIDSFRRFDIYSYIGILKKILANYQSKKIGEILKEEGKLDQHEIRKILEEQKSSAKKFGEIAVEKKLISESEFKDALVKQAASVKKTSYVRVSNDRLNGLIDIVGELVVNQSMLRQYLQNPEASREASERTIAQLESITTNIKNLVLSMGMVPIGEIFNKLRVVVRNTAAETAKTVVVDFKGEETELDRNVIESIYDPMVHIVRNAVDHGLEAPERREAEGKPRVGHILIQAEHKGNGIEVSVSDDGKGIIREKVLAKAIASGLTTPDQSMALSEKDVNAFLFMPGFSTAERVTEVSGRGVGLDVVKKNIDQIHGKVEVQSKEGQGTRFVIRIPLTLAIIDGFVTVVNGTKYIFPFNLIEEILVPDSGAVIVMDNGQHMILNRGAHVPLIFSSKVFRHKGVAFDGKNQAEGKLIIVISYEQKRYGIVVDSIVGKQEIVIKSLSEALYRLKVFSGGTIFGDGSIGFVVDIEEFIDQAREAEE